MNNYAIGRLHKLPLVLQEDFAIPGSFAFAGEKIFPGLHGDVQLRGRGRALLEALCGYTFGKVDSLCVKRRIIS